MRGRPVLLMTMCLAFPLDEDVLHSVSVPAWNAPEVSGSASGGIGYVLGYRGVAPSA